MQRKLDVKLALESDEQRHLAASLKAGDGFCVVPCGEHPAVHFYTDKEGHLLRSLQGDDCAKLLEACYNGPCKATLRTLRRDAASGSVAELTLRVLPDERAVPPPPPRTAGAATETGAPGEEASAGGGAGAAAAAGDAQMADAGAAAAAATGGGGDANGVGSSGGQEGAAGGASNAPPEPPPVIDNLDEEQVAMRLCRSQLEALAADGELPGHLRNGRLQEAIRRVDAAPDREAALEQALVNHDFSAFCEKVLDTLSTAKCEER